MAQNLKPISGWCGGNSPSRARGANYQRCVNLRVEKNPDPSRPFVLYPRAGKRKFAEVTDVGFRHIGAWAGKSTVFFACGTNVYQLFEDGTFTVIGEIAVGSNPATFRANGSQLLICVAGVVYIATGTAFYQPIISFARGTVDVSGVNVTWRSGDKFAVPGDSISPGNYFQIGDAIYQVAADPLPTDTTLTVVPDPVTGAPMGGVNLSYQAGEELLTGSTIEFIDGYFIVGIPNSKSYRISALDDGKSWDALDIAQKSGSTDNISAVWSLNGDLALFGDTNSTEIWGDSGNADFPFQRMSGKSISMGVDASWSVAKLFDGSICALAYSDSGDGIIVMTNGGAPDIISDRALENAMRSFPRINDAIGSTFLEDGHQIYRIRFPSVDRAFDFDKTSGVWTEAGVYSPDDEVYFADRGGFHVHVTWPSQRRMSLSFDFTNGKIYQNSVDFADDDGVDFPLLRIGPYSYTNMQEAICGEFVLECELGTIAPLPNGNPRLGPDGKLLIPTVNMSYSDNGCRTWTDGGAAALGRIGEYEGIGLNPQEQFDITPGSQTNPQAFEPIPRWTMLGRFFISRAFKIKSNGSSLRAIFNALVDITSA